MFGCDSYNGAGENDGGWSCWKGSSRQLQLPSLPLAWGELQWLPRSRLVLMSGEAFRAQGLHFLHHYRLVLLAEGVRLGAMRNIWGVWSQCIFPFFQTGLGCAPCLRPQSSSGLERAQDLPEKERKQHDPGFPVLEPENRSEMPEAVLVFSYIMSRGRCQASAGTSACSCQAQSRRAEQFDLETQTLRVEEGAAEIPVAETLGQPLSSKCMILGNPALQKKEAGKVLLMPSRAPITPPSPGLGLQ